MIKYVWAFSEHQVLKTMREKCPNTEFFLVRIFLYSDWRWRCFFWSVFSCIRTEYGDVLSGPYIPVFELNTEMFFLVRIQENTDQKNFRI